MIGVVGEVRRGSPYENTDGDSKLSLDDEGSGPAVTDHLPSPFTRLTSIRMIPAPHSPPGPRR